MQTEKKKPARVWPVVKAYGRVALRHRPLFVTAFFGLLIIQASELVWPLYLKRFVDALATSSPASAGSLFTILALYATVVFIGWIGQRIRTYGVHRLETRSMQDLYNDAFSYLMGHGHEFFISNFIGTLTRRVMRYARSFEGVFDNVIYNIVPTFIFGGGVIIVLWQRSIYLGAGLLTWTILFLYIQYRTVVWIQPLRFKRSAADSHATGALSDAVLNHATISAFAALPLERKIFGETISDWYRATMRSWNTDAWIDAIQGFLASFIEIALLGGAVLLWQQGILTVGDFVLIQVYVFGLLNQIWNIGRNMRQLNDAFSEASEMLDIMDLPHEIQDAKDAKPLVVTEGAMALDHVRFEYHGTHSVLNDFSLAIQPHEKVALIGSSGAGKTTIAKLLLRLYDISDGTISIDGQNIARVTQESLRSAIAFVPQEPALFHRSLMENIRYGRQDATDEEVIEAAKQAHCFEFISQYPEGFDTLVGERGVKLSGGERQRVAIARAILKDAPILVLDEATSSLDSESERLIQAALLRLMAGKTVIAIAHRLSTVMHMDRLIVMEKGSVVLTGSHEELLAQESNLYKKLWEIQAGGFIRKD
ncbi:MAG: ABC transporter ATP-binding protein [Minisyncoccia bacterium]